MRSERWVSILRVCLPALTAIVVLSAAGSQGVPNSRHVWKVYTNVRFEYSICYPQDLLTPAGEAENSDGQKFVAKDGTKLVVFGTNNALNESPGEMMKDTSSRLAGESGKVTYKLLKPDWFVLSGLSGTSIFYAKTLYSPDRSKSFELTYDKANSAVYNPLAGRLASCFVNTKH